MAYFDCIVGGNGKGNTVIVTCDADFAGATITMSKTGKTYSKTCPSTAPYTVTFEGVENGTYTISGTISGHTYTSTVVVQDISAVLSAGFDWRSWVALGGLDSTDYSDLDDVFADEAAVRRLMTVHASADYLIDCVTENVDDIDDFCANDTAMKWIGLRDYVCDGLTAIDGVWTKFLASDYWERILKDHVPVMTSNTAPYGTAFANGTSSGSSYPIYYAFDGNDSTAWRYAATTVYIGYQFTNPICVKKIHIYANYNSSYTVKLQGSNDNSTWTDLLSISIEGPTTIDEAVPNDGYYLYYRLYTTNSSSTTIQIASLQFYGRSLNMSIPDMTSNTAPYGEITYSSGVMSNDSYKTWGLFSSSYQWARSNTNAGSIQYKAVRPWIPKMAVFNVGSYNSRIVSCKLQAGNDGTNWTDLTESFSPQTLGSLIILPLNNNTPYYYFRLYISSVTSNPVLNRLQFYGLDYSEREFEEGSTKKWLYDHGVELETLDKTTCKHSSINIVDDGKSIEIDMSASASANKYVEVLTNDSIDLSDYDYVFIGWGDKIISATNDFGSLAVFTQKPTNYDTIGSYRDATISGVIPLSHLITALSISSFNENKYIGVGTRTGGSYAYDYKFNELWLE